MTEPTRPASDAYRAHPRVPGERLARSVLWRRLDQPGLEHFRLWEHAEGIRLEGSVVGVHASVPTTVEYEVECGSDWTTTRALVAVVWGGIRNRIELRADAARRWWVDGQELPALFGCPDVDISVTPSTNTLPIRRLALAAGQSCDVTAAWVRVGPDLAVQPLAQRYTRLVAGQYRYESAGGAFSTVLSVDDAGVVVRYPPAWERAPLGPLGPLGGPGA